MRLLKRKYIEMERQFTAKLDDVRNRNLQLQEQISNLTQTIDNMTEDKRQLQIQVDQSREDLRFEKVSRIVCFV